MSSYTNSKIYSLDEYLSSSLPAPTSPSSLIGLYPIRLPTSSRDPGLNDWFIPIQLLASSTDLAQVQVACSTLPLKLNLRFSLLCRFFDPTSLGFTPFSRSFTRSVIRTSTSSVDFSTRKALVNSVVVTVLAPLSTASPYPNQIAKPNWLSPIHHQSSVPWSHPSMSWSRVSNHLGFTSPLFNGSGLFFWFLPSYASSTSSANPKTNSLSDSAFRSLPLHSIFLSLKFSMSRCCKPSAPVNCCNLSKPRHFVKISVVYWSVGTYTSLTSDERTRSWTKW